MRKIIGNGPAIAAAVAAVLALAPRPAFAMHLADGILPARWAGLWWFIALPFIWLGVRALKEGGAESTAVKPFIGLVGAAVFIISCMPIPVPFTGTTSHPCGTGIAAILIGPRLTVLVSSIALVLQALFLAHGGITTLGANVVSMGIAGAFTGYGVFRAAKAMGLAVEAAAFFAGLLSDWVTYAATSAELAAALHGDGSFWTMFAGVMAAFIPTQLPLGIIEGIVSAAACQFIMARRPDLIADVSAKRVAG